MQKLLMAFGFVFYAGALLLQAQHFDFRFDHYTVKDGLSQSQPYSILQDSWGYLWVGTQDGLNRFDGHEFTIFKNDPFDTTSLTHNWVWSVQEDARGDLWIGTFQGLCKYIRREDRFLQYYHDPQDTASISGNRPNAIIKDNQGRLWISSWGSGLNLYDEKTNSFRRFLNKKNDLNSLSDNAVRTLFCDSEGIIWVGTWNGGLNKVIEDANGIRFERYRPEEDKSSGAGNRITSIAEDKDGSLWIATYGSGLFKFDKKKTTFTNVSDFHPKDVNKVMCDLKGNTWVGTNDGLVFFESKTGRHKHFTHMPDDPGSIGSNTIYSIYEDRTGNIWISGNGLEKYDPRKNNFKTFQKRAGDPGSLQHNMVWSFCEDDDGQIWIGAESGPLSVFNPKTQTFAHKIVNDDKGRSAMNIHRIVFSQGFFWLASYNSGLVKYEKKTGKAKFYWGSHPSPLGKVQTVHDVLVDDHNTVWVGSNSDGLFHLNHNDEVIHYVADPKNENSISSNLISSLYKDNRGNIWIGFLGGGLNVYDKVSKKFIAYHYDRKNANGLSDQVVTSVTQENDSIYWIGTHSGLNRLNKITGRFTHFFEKDGLANNVVYDLLLDNNGNYWISSNGGITRFNPKEFKFKTYTFQDGLQSNEFNSHAALKSTTGDFYFGGVNGFNVFRPEDIQDNQQPPELIIQNYKIFDQTYLPGEEITLKHNQNYLSLQFAAMEFSAPNNVKYKYILEGFDKDWNDAGNRRIASYTNLDPGNYTFRVTAANPDGYWTTPGESISITITPPFWATIWFMALVSILVVGLIYCIHRYRLAQSLKVERLRNKIASDLHDEVGSSLTRISIYSDLLQNGVESEERKNYLTGIGELSREVVSTMSDIVWSIDNRNDTMGSLIIRMKDFASEVLQAQNIDLEFTFCGVDKNATVDPAVKQNIYLIFKESIHNVVKHAHANHVNVSLVNEGKEFRMIIKDDGCGFSINGTSRGNGLRNMLRRSEAIEGEFHIQNHHGTTLMFKRKAL